MQHGDERNNLDQAATSAREIDEIGCEYEPGEFDAIIDAIVNQNRKILASNPGCIAVFPEDYQLAIRARLALVT